MHLPATSVRRGVEKVEGGENVSVERNKGVGSLFAQDKDKEKVKPFPYPRTCCYK
jgi:hypothetical protein